MDHWYIKSKQNSLLGCVCEGLDSLGSHLEGLISCVTVPAFPGLLLLHLGTQIPAPSKTGVGRQGQAGAQRQLPRSVFQHLVPILFAGNLS